MLLFACLAGLYLLAININDIAKVIYINNRDLEKFLAQHTMISPYFAALHSTRKTRSTIRPSLTNPWFNINGLTLFSRNYYAQFLMLFSTS